MSLATVLELITLFIVTAGIPIDNGFEGTHQKEECMNTAAVDLVFLMDSSGSIGDPNFELERNFITMLVQHLTVAPNETRIGLLQFSGDVQVEFRLGDFATGDAVRNAIKGIGYLTGTTRTGNALSVAKGQMFRNARGGSVPKIAVVVTDGQSQDDVRAPAEALRSDDVTIYAIGITNLVNERELEVIAGSPSRVFIVERFKDLDEQLAKIIMKEMCKTVIEKGTAEIECLSDRIAIFANVRKPFEGNVFVKGHFHVAGCRKSGEDFAANPLRVGISIPFTECDVQRSRSINPKGVFVEVTVVFSFHPFFLTKVDQAIKVQCFYMEADKTVSSELEVSMLTTQFVTENVPMPVCSYTIRSETSEGPIVTFAYVGQQVYHRWECVEQTSEKGIYGMLVHSCVVDDGQGERVQLIDQFGCGIDRYLLGTPEYQPSLLLAFKEAHVFKYADRSTLYFTCQVTLCVRYGGGCDDLTPPKNCRTKQRRALDLSEFQETTMDLSANVITVLDVETEKKSKPEVAAEKSANSTTTSRDAAKDDTCISYTELFLLLASLVLSLLVSCIMGGFLLWTLRKKWS